MKFRFPLPTSTIHGQITAIVLVCLFIVILTGTTVERWATRDNDVPDLELLSDRVSSISSILASASPSERIAIVAIANRGGWNLSLEPLSFSERFTASLPNEPFVYALIDRFLPPDDTTVPYGGWRTFVDGKRVVASKIDDKQLLVLSQFPETLLSLEALRFGSNYLVALVTLMVLFSVFAVWAITRPLRRIASAAIKADISVGPALFEERGSVEIVALARALNGMQRRISSMVDARTRMLRGISHDLRTPLTRLRLRADRVGEKEVRDALLVDIDRISHLLKESLVYLRDNHRTEAFERADLASVLQTVCDEFSDMGHEISYRGPARLVASFRPLAITRAVTNLCDNATKFGHQVDVELSERAGTAIIEVKDDGPGIPLAHRGRVLEPFYKGDTARGGPDAGFGLGLSIIAEIVQAHHGKLELLDRDPKGLIARIAIPLTQNG